MPLLKINNLTKNFGGLAAVSNVNLEVGKNELVGLIGPNGAGKTTLFNLLTGVYEPSEGDILFYDEGKEERLNGLKPFKVANKGLSRTFQNIRLFKDLTVLENVLIAMNGKQPVGVLTGILRLPNFYKSEKRMTQKALELLEIFDLKNKEETLAKNLSYGEQRRLEIVRALATEPKLLFLDEPAAGMNPQETVELTELIKKVQREFDLTILLIEHDMSLVMDVCERIYVLEYGQMIAEGKPEEIKTNKRVIKAYLGGDL
ncbi:MULTISPECIES: ABC transporter ATP-binding protein [Vagococcus]|uniref:Branched-chain amino acid transport ATP-binding protein LivG (TC 3.A.1.4.1) n=1 Tax=Vagococcus fluvialis bH819 TaxID=1255619 RepID=A0A1X6WQ29_9ENTE|nr:MULTISPECIES: ABC transporter ATP-binding protein [Vagococcus]SLM86414.1 Branched-chain amino acid transport ATP-binding protein LivG (TC 3.A.1.4.1) [Vagococcus fluvialis bH819]HCM89069.1 ABC transporter ATP-binding protein [Vagococcus sp.]